MADSDITPTQPIAPTPVVRPPEQKKGGNPKKQHETADDQEDEQSSNKPKEDHRGEWVDEYV